MPKQLSTDSDPLAIKPIIEALIFASEEPLSTRTLIRLLSGESARPSERIPQLLNISEEDASELMNPVPMESGSSTAHDEESGEPDREPSAKKPRARKRKFKEPEIDDHPVEGTEIEKLRLESQVIDNALAGGISLVVDDEDDLMERKEGTNEPDLSAAVDDLADALERASTRTSRKLPAATEEEPLDQRYVRRLIEELNHEYDVSNRAFRIVEVAGGFQFATLREYGEYVAMLSKEKGRRRLSPAALETLAIIAYRQPVSKPEIEAIRGVNCDQVLLNLMEKNLVAITGRSEGVGRPLLYGTSDDFLRSFGINMISDLPKLREIEELMEEGALSATKAEVLEIEEGSDAEEIEAKVGAMGHREEDEPESEDAMIGG